jgi:DNA polymerase-3 subunit epsilon
MAFPETPFVVTDTETTGHRAEDGRLIEIAAVKVLGGRVVDRFSQLVNPGRSIPPRITRLTGISTGMVLDQPRIEEVMPAYLKFLGEGVLVAHNLSFDLAFLNAELRRMGQPLLDRNGLCTLRLARRLLRGLRSKGLTGVAAFYRIPIDGRHRALGDASATAEILLRFLRRLATEYEIETVEELLAFQYRTYGRPRARSGAHSALIESLRTLPERPGVYYMKDGGGRIVYIGKAKRLRTRVRSYFTAIEGHDARLRTLVDVVEEIVWDETASELEALLLESRQIKQHAPRFNQAQLRYKNRPFLRLDESAPFPKIDVSPFLLDDEATYFGPLASRREAELLVDLIQRWFLTRPCTDRRFADGKACLYAEMGRCEAPCEGQTDADVYRKRVRQVRAFLAGQDPTVLSHLEEQMRIAARDMRFEEAALYRDLFELVGRLLARQRCIAAPVLDHHAVVISDEPGDGRRLLLAVRFGRLVEALPCDAAPAGEEAERIRAFVGRAFGSDRRPEPYFKPEIEDVRLLVHWLFTHQEEVRQVGWIPGESEAAFAERVLVGIAAFGRPA